MEGSRREHRRPHEQIVQPLVIPEVEALDRIASTPAADEVHQPIDPAEPLDQRRTPFLRLALLQQIDDPHVEPFLR